MFRDKGQIYKFGPFRLIPLERQLMRDDELIPLTPKSFDLLVVLVENSGHLVEKSQLMEQIWPDSFVEEANLSVKMSELRRALGEGPNEHRYIETVPRRGYRFVADVKEIGGGIAGVEENIDANAADPRVEEVVEPSVHLSVEPPTRSPFRRRAFFTVGILAIVPVCIWLYAGGIFQRTQTRPINIQSVAVLPLEDRSGDPLKYYIADGIVNALIADLAKISATSRCVALLGNAVRGNEKRAGGDRPRTKCRRGTCGIIYANRRNFASVRETHFRRRWPQLMEPKLRKASSRRTRSSGTDAAGYRVADKDQPDAAGTGAVRKAHVSSIRKRMITIFAADFLPNGKPAAITTTRSPNSNRLSL